MPVILVHRKIQLRKWKMTSELLTIASLHSFVTQDVQWKVLSFKFVRYFLFSDGKQGNVKENNGIYIARSCYIYL